MDVVDTDILIDVQRGHKPAVDWFAHLTELPAIPGFVVMELVQDARNKREVENALKLVAPLPVVWPTATDCEQALRNFATYHLSHGLGLLDALIASCVLGLAGRLCTFNEKHYAAIPGLATVKPYSR
jgi:predicted nucleic acid-binding protein